MNFKGINWALVLVLLGVAIVGGVISQLIVVEGVNSKGEPVRKLAIGGKKESDV